MSPSVPPDDPATSTRREFAAALAILAATPLAGHTQPAVPTKKSEKPAPDPIQVSAQHLTDMVQVRYGKYLTEAQMKKVRQSVEGNLRAAERLKQFKLTNGDEPSFAFHADLS